MATVAIHLPPSRAARVVGPWACLLGGLLFGAGTASAERELLMSTSVGWDSAYVSEGRDNLGEGGLLSGAVDVGWREWAISGWVARGDRVDYREFNFGLSRSFTIGRVELSLSYTRLEFAGIEKSPGDNELGLAAMLPLPGGLELGAGGRYSTRAAGAFGELVIRRPWTLGATGCLLIPYVAQGVDHGYASADHDGANHLEGGLALEYPLGGGVTLHAYGSRCWAQRDVHLAGGGDLTWGGVSLALEF